MPDEVGDRQGNLARRRGAKTCAHGLPGGWAIGVVAAVMLALSWGAISLGIYTGRAASDQLLFHEPTVRMFARQWPRTDLSDYLSATSPGYHLALAMVARTMTDSRAGLQMAGALFTVAMAGVLVWVCLRELRSAGVKRCAGWRALWVCMPMLASVYVFLPGVWLLPDNAGWLMVLVVFVLAQARISAGGWMDVRSGSTCGRRFGAEGLWWIACAAALLGVVFVRQSHLWVAGVLMAAAYVRPRRNEPVSTDGSVLALFDHVPRRLAGAMLAGLAVVPAAVVLAMFAKMWGGLVPPRFQGQHASANPATPALALSLLAVYSVFFIGFWGESLRGLWREKKWLVLLCAMAGMVLAAVPETTYAYPARGSGIWGAVRVLQERGVVLMGRTSPLLLVLAPIGAVALCAWVADVRGARRWVLLGVFVAYVLAQTANANAWQRYLEPGLLMFVAMFACWGWRDGMRGAEDDRSSQWRCGRVAVPGMMASARWIGPAVLTTALALITAREFFFGSRLDPANPPPMPPEVRLPEHKG